MIARHQVVLFLHLAKMAAAKRFVFRDRKTNRDTLALLGINRQDAQDRVMGLTPEDYVRGPDPDHNHPTLDVWVFGLSLSGEEVYAKLQVISDPPEQCVCISFHVSKHPMHYPFREHGVTGE